MRRARQAERIEVRSWRMTAQVSQASLVGWNSDGGRKDGPGRAGSPIAGRPPKYSRQSSGTDSGSRCQSS